MAADSECMYIHDQVHKNMTPSCPTACDFEDGAVQAALFTTFQSKTSRPKR